LLENVSSFRTFVELFDKFINGSFLIDNDEGDEFMNLIKFRDNYVYCIVINENEKNEIDNLIKELKEKNKTLENMREQAWIELGFT
jgi:cell division septum initiation protein DivIVA